MLYRKVLNVFKNLHRRININKPELTKYYINNYALSKIININNCVQMHLEGFAPFCRSRLTDKPKSNSNQADISLKKYAFFLDIST